jgi:malonyl-CoA O-methyltransferase
MLSWRHWFAHERPTQLALRDGYARWATNYPPHAHNPLMAAEQAAVVSLLSSLTPQCVLDVGTGTGRNVTLLSAAGATRIVGVDLSLAMLAGGHEQRRSVCADACALPFADGRFDLVVSSLMVGDVRALGVWTAEMSRVLKPGGHLVYSDFHPIWARQRWRRTFRDAEGHQYELPYFPHALDEHFEALAAVDFDVRALREPSAEGRTEPVVVVLEAVKRS